MSGEKRLLNYIHQFRAKITSPKTNQTIDKENSDNLSNTGNQEDNNENIEEQEDENEDEIEIENDIEIGH
jgi:hypothetical protein